ncbi:hypothetical protein [Roseiarcus fermentans]|uniref:hypothetical protein n=1 Tax=Roseiarcus fermentans TaxID=1473586 RepID=UPI0011BECDB1|nr:hypothetical protein [Roseiarcus fermentans]
MNNKRIRPDRIGSIGEGRFRELCELAGLAISKPFPDMTGKDFSVEFDFVEPIRSLTLDTRPSALEFIAQVKTIGHSSRRVSLDLRVAERLVRNPTPTFLVIVRLPHGAREDQAIPDVEISLIHIHNGIIETILKRLREEHLQGSTELNKKTVSFGIKKSYPVGQDPLELKKYLLSCIGNDIFKYIDIKREFVASCGYEQGRYRVSLEFDKLSIDDFYDGILGLTDLPAIRVDHFDRRFGISILNEAESIGGRSILKFEPSACATVKLSVTGRNSGKSIFLDGELFLPDRFITEGVFRFRVKTTLIEWMVGNEGVRVFLSEDRHREPHPLETFLRAYDCLCMVAEEPFNVIFSIKGMSDIVFNVDRTESASDMTFFAAMIPVLEAAMELRKRAKASDKPILIGDLIEQRFHITSIYKLLTGSTDINMSFQTDLPVQSLHLLPSDALYIVRFAVGSSFYGCAFRSRIEPKAECDRVNWVCSQLTLLDTDELSGDLRSEYLNFRERLISISGIKSVIEESIISKRKSSSDAEPAEGLQSPSPPV